jgi:anti-sigma factor RsiW
MNCDEVRRHWNLYHDSEGDATIHLHINEHLASCPSCAEWFFKQSLFEDLLTQRLAPTHADPQLWQAVLAGAGVVTPASRANYVRPMLLIAALAAVVLIAVTASIVQLGGPRGEPSNLSGIAANFHARLAGGDIDVPLRSESDLEVEDFLRQQVAFPVRCPPRKDAGFAVEGAGTCRLGGQAAAYLVGNVEQQPVSIFVLSRDSLAAFPHQQAALRSESVHRCREGNCEMALSVIDRNLVVVIGQAPSEELVRVLAAYGTYPHDSSG